MKYVVRRKIGDLETEAGVEQGVGSMKYVVSRKIGDLETLRR